MKIYNSLTKKVEEFAPINPPNVGMYTCGITAYDYAHIGHGRKYVMDDLLKRTLTFLGFKVNHVQNVTDVGHLSSDADEGEDKMEKGAEKFGKTVWEVSEFFTKNFYDSMDKLNIIKPDIVCKATDHIKEQIEMIKKLFENGYAYDTEEAVYFDTSKFKTYGDLFGQSLESKKEAVREEVQKGEHKKNSADFALWFKRIGRFSNHIMHWESPWGDGFPGWHIECSAMSTKYLGEQFDIHTGGEDLLPIHHPNEIAQSEGASGKSPFVKYWIHYAFLMVDGKKMSKSLGNFFTIEDIEKKGFDPISLRYLYMTTHYKKPLNFTLDSLKAAETALFNLRNQVAVYKSASERTVLSPQKMEKVDVFRNSFVEAISNDLNFPKALSVLWEALKSNIPDYDKYDLLVSFDEVLGLSLLETSNSSFEAPEKVQTLLKEREGLRHEGKFEEADKKRVEIEDQGFLVLDTKEGAILKKK